MPKLLQQNETDFKFVIFKFHDGTIKLREDGSNRENNQLIPGRV